MLVLHALWSPDLRLSLWAEDLSSDPSRARKGGRKTQAHPFSVEPEAIRVQLSEAFGAIAAKGTAGETELPLPTVSGLPLPSREASEHAAEWASWRVPTLAFEGPVVVDVLLRLLPEPTLMLRVGESLKVWSALMTLALDLVARGRVLPVFCKDGPDVRSEWRPVPEERDRFTLRNLAKALPGLCRAGLGQTERPEGPASLAAVEEVLEAFTDLAMRRVFRGYTFPMGKGPAAEKALIRSLVSADGLAEGAGTGPQAHLQALEGWMRPIWAEQSKPFRLCFRLSEAEGKQPWRLGFLLQASDDPSLKVEAGQIWTRGKALEGVLKRRLNRPDEFLLGELGRALRVYPSLERALKTARPEGLDLDATGAHDFLKEAAPVLEAAGFGILAPNWWQKPARISLRMSAKPKEKQVSRGLLGLDSLCEFQWEIALGGQEITIRELLALAKLKQPLVQFRGQWVELDPAQIQAALDYFKKHGLEGERSARDLMRLGLGLERGPEGLDVQAIQAEGWLGQLMSNWDDRKLKPLKAPGGLDGKLRPYQARGFGWLAFLGELGLGACLADDMGLGKTIQMLAWLLHRRKPEPPTAASGEERGLRPRGARGRGGTQRAQGPGGPPTVALPPALLVCPMSLVGNWHKEAARFAPDLKIHVHHGTERHKGGGFKDADLVLTTYQLLARDREPLAAQAWDALILDEAQHIKNPESQARKAVASIQAAHRFALSGTPVENRLSELWSILDVLNPGLLGSSGEFRRAFSLPIERYRDEAKAAQLRQFTAPFILRRLKTDRRIIQDLPEKLEMKVHCTLTKEQASLYQATVQDMVAQVEESKGIQRKGLILATLMKLKQICNHPTQFLQDKSSLEGRSGKLDALEETVGEILDAGEKVLVFTQFREMGGMLAERLTSRFGEVPLFLHGGTSKKQRDAMVARFQAAGGPGVFLLSLKAGGVGLNLTAANHVIHFDRWWNPAVENQATDRAFRIGQTKNVQVRKFICSGTLEEKIDALIESKRELAESVVGSGEGWLTELDTRSFRDLVALGRDALQDNEELLDAKPKAPRRSRKAVRA